MTNWYAVYTRVRLEKKVAEAFTRRNIESYCPVQEAPRPWLGKKVPPAALFPNYVFVRLTQEQLTAVKKVEGVINLVYWLGRPAGLDGLMLGFAAVRPDALNKGMERLADAIEAAADGGLQRGRSSVAAVERRR